LAAAFRVLRMQMSPLAMNVVRYGIPAAFFVAGCAIALSSDGGGLAAGAMFISAATAVLLLNVLYRMGVQGDKERDREEEARRYFDEHGRWPS
jgi:O-antigen/teichoic acid export membrane protein